MGVKKAFSLSRLTLNLFQSHRVAATKHNHLFLAFRSACSTGGATYSATTQHARMVSKPFSSCFPPKNDSLQPTKPEEMSPVNPANVVPSSKVDVNIPMEELYGKIRRLHSDLVLEMLQTSYKQLDNIALAISLRRLHDVMLILPEPSRQVYIEHVRRSAGFQIMSALLARNAQHLSAEVVFDMTRFLADFGLDSDHPAQQINLQLGRSHINDLAIDQLVQLATTLSEMTSTDQTNTLFDGIGVLCAARENDVKILSVDEKISLLKFYGDRFSEQYQSQIVGAIKRELADVNWKLAVPLLEALEHIQVSNLAIMSSCIDAISRDVYQLSQEDVFATLDTCFAHKLYTPDLLFAFGHKSIVEKYDICEKLVMLGKFHPQSFVHVALIEDVIGFVASDPKAFQCFHSLDSRLSLEFLQCIAQANIWTRDVPRVVDRLRQTVTESYSLLEPTTLLQVCLSLAILKQPVPSDLARQLFQSESVEQLLSTDTSLSSGPVHAHPITVAEKLILVTSASEASDLSEHCLQLIEEEARKSGEGQRSLPLKRALEMCLDNEPYTVEHDVTSKSGLHIDHLVRCDTTDIEHPVTVGGKQVLPPSKPVAVLVFDGACFQRNTGQVKGATHLYCRTLQRGGYLVAVINWTSFQKVEERDRLEYLQHKILFASDYQDLHMIGIDNIGHTE